MAGDSEQIDGFPPLQSAERLHVCLTCGAPVVDKMIRSHADWHKAISSVAIETTKRVDRLESSLVQAQDNADRDALIAMQSWDAAERNP